MVRHWLSIIVEDDTVIYDGMGHEVGRILGVFYVENVLIGHRIQNGFRGTSMYSLDCSTEFA